MTGFRSAMTCAAPERDHAKPGDPIRLGTCIGCMEPDWRTARLVGIRHNPSRELYRYILRKYRNNEERFPTGDYVTASVVGLIPHALPRKGDHPDWISGGKIYFAKEQEK